MSSLVKLFHLTKLGISGTLLCLALFPTSLAQAAPARRDWCGKIWSVENARTLAWVDPNTGETTTGTGPTSEITMPSGDIGTSVAALGLHTPSGTMFAFDRDGETGTLYKYKFGVDTNWVKLSVSGLVGLDGTSPVTDASTNLNKMTVDGNLLYIVDATGIALYTIQLDNNGNVISDATNETYSYSGDPPGTPPHDVTSSPNMNGGDVTTDEYGDTYNITYDNSTPFTGSVTTKAYFYKQNPATRQWIYQGETDAINTFAGAIFARGPAGTGGIYIKAGGQLQFISLTRSGSGYTGWNNPVINQGTSFGNSIDLAGCGTPNIVLTKTQKIYLDATTGQPAANQGSVKTDQYIQYTVTAQNIGDSWARSAYITDNLPSEVTYVPNSAKLNGVNIGLAVYPTNGQFSVNTPGQIAGSGILDFSTPPNIATLTFVVKVISTTGSVQNQVTTVYSDSAGVKSEVPICIVGQELNCTTAPDAPVANDGQLLMVKRVTAVNGKNMNPNDGTSLGGLVLDSIPNNADNNTKWPSNYLAGSINGGKVVPGDEVEYTIYYMNIGYTRLKGARVCDRLNTNLNYVPNFNASNVGKGISFSPQGATPIYLTNTSADADRGQFIAPLGAIPTNCNLAGATNPNGIIVVDVSDSSNPLAASGYGYIKFKTKVR